MVSSRHFSKGLLAIVAIQGLTACASLRSENPPVCDGRHRRPANPYGSILVAPSTPDAVAPAPDAPEAVEGTDAMGGCA